MNTRKFITIVIVVAAIIIAMGLAFPKLRAWLGVTLLPLA